MLIIVLVAISFFVHTCHGSCRQVDRDVLTSFNLSISAASPLNWSLSVDCCSWEGIACDNSGRVTKLWIPSRGLLGTISSSILNLTALSQLNLSNNLLSGPLPDEFFASFNSLLLADLSSNRLSQGLPASDKLPCTIRTLKLSSNHFNGTIESSFLQSASNLEAFDVSNNDFLGSIPSGICGFSPSIQRLDFSNNNFEGPIPPSFSHCSKLQSLRAGFNELSGEIPGEIYRLLNLQELYMPGNKLSGQMDNRIANLINLKVLALFDNDLTGTIPLNIGKLSKLEHLLLHLNLLNGTIPQSLSNCTQLVSLNLQTNFLEGELSAFDFSRFSNLTSIDLKSNSFTGALPETLFSCRKLKGIGLSYNSLSGEIPREIVALRSLTLLSLSSNNLTNVLTAIRRLMRCKSLSTLTMGQNFYDEELPGQEGLIAPKGFQNLRLLSLFGCRITGPFPMWLPKLVNLAVVDLTGNSITGSIPGSIGALPNLFYLDLSKNQISGELPVELTQLRALASPNILDQVRGGYFEIPLSSPTKGRPSRQLNGFISVPPAIMVGNNIMSGTIPAEIGNLKALVKLCLDHNHFSGNIPDSISDLTNLETLLLSENQLSGEIPATFQNLHFLSYFNVSYNNLQGKIPSGQQFNTFSSSSFEGNPRLCGSTLQNSCHDDNDNKPKEGHNEIMNWRFCFSVGYVISFIISAPLAFAFLKIEMVFILCTR